ncbi:hypothetical protein WME76_02100 [Sorangium sp. So ce119]|uniref:hypothetical protein n=1 Tax=Sorangium sp. So ce119 TaxID=3133279 RepID=UPI003F617591
MNQSERDWGADLAAGVTLFAIEFLAARGVTRCEGAGMLAAKSILIAGVELALQCGVPKGRLFTEALPMLARLTNTKLVTSPIPVESGSPKKPA